MSVTLEISKPLMACMWTVALMIIVFSLLLIFTGTPRKKENSVNEFFMYYFLLCNILTPVFMLVAAIDTTVEDGEDVEEKYRMLCSFCGYIGVLGCLLSLSTMLTMATNLFLWLLFPRCFKQGKNYLPKIRGITAIEALIILVVITFPFLPFDAFEAGQVSSRYTLCLPLHSPWAPMWEVTLVLYIVESLGVFTLFLLFVVMLCHLTRQRNVPVSAIPMEVRVQRKNSLLVKRLCCTILGTVIFWIPGLLTVLCMFAGVEVSGSVLQWMFGVVQPFGNVAGSFLYFWRVRCKNCTFSSCLKGTKNRVVNGRDAVRLQIGQLTGAITMPQKMDGDGDGKPDGNHTPSVDSIPTPQQKNGKCVNAPPVVHWVETVPIIGRHMNTNFGIVEWLSKNGSPRRGLLKIFTKPHSREWRNESSILYRLSQLEHHRNIVEYLWHSKSSQTKLDRGQSDTAHPDQEKPAIQRFVCTAYYQHGTLRDFLHSHPRTIQESHVHAIATQVSAGMAYLHAMRIVHGLMETTSVLIGGHIETMAIKVVIANFSRAIDLTRKLPSDIDKSSQKDVTTSSPPSNATSSVPGAVNVPGSTVCQEMEGPQQTATAQPQVSEKLLCSGDVRSFALLLLEMMAWLKMIRVPEDGQPTSQTKSWTLDRRPKRGVTRGWTLAPSDTKAWTDDMCHVTLNRNASSSVDSCGSDDGLASALRCWENAVADCTRRDGYRCPSPKEFRFPTSDSAPWEEVGTFPRRTKQVKSHPVGESSSDCTLGSQPQKAKKFHSSSESSGTGSKKDLSNGPASKEEAKKSLANMTEDGSCCIVNPYFDMMASEDEQEKPHSTKEVPPAPEQESKSRENNLIQVADDSQGFKRDSMCSLDSGISSHQSSMRSSSSDKMNKRADSVPSGVKPKANGLLQKRQRMTHQLDVHGTFETYPENADKMGKASNSNSQQQTGQNVETWVENHVAQNGHNRPGVVLDRTKRAKPRVPETLQEIESPDVPPRKDTIIHTTAKLQNSTPKEECNQQSRTEFNRENTVTNTEETNGDKVNGKSQVTVTRSASSLSQFYIRKRAPRPHNITIVPGSTTTLPASLQRRTIHAPDSPRLMDLGRGRPSSCHVQVAANKSNSLDSSSSYGQDSVDNPCCAQCSPGNSSSSASLPRKTRSLEDSCLSPMSVTSPKPGISGQPEQGMPMISMRKLHRQDAILESINETSSRLTNPHSSHSFEDKLQSGHKRASRRKAGPSAKRVPVTGISQQHVNFCQELQALLPCLPKVVLGFWWKQQGCGQAVLQWIDSLKDHDGCLYNQLIGILETCWGQEPALPSSQVHLMLDNCLTEVAL
ncbi:uncharacterized protein LOC110979617 isoform X2 [Acanthaster planci]|uniref:Uncharacterized protein LOC110979617 isoform X2 n=1 Tax=Acanthaster planci TaxID=133434 RepID=A0A8B7YFB6_ACAPL|nr:uncharacterized protein LOC110979617 isoform X2 [Acanthaster planci]